jgi:hypothetical protein
MLGSFDLPPRYKVRVDGKVWNRFVMDSRVPVSLLNFAGKIPIFCGSFGHDREFRDGTEIRGNREKIDREVGKMGSAASFAGNSG